MSAKKKILDETDSVMPKTRIDYSKGWAYVNIRMPTQLLLQLDKHLNQESKKTPRQHWIMNAIAEKLERDK